MRRRLLSNTFKIVPTDPVRWSWVEVEGRGAITHHTEGPTIVRQTQKDDTDLLPTEETTGCDDSMEIDDPEDLGEDGNELSNPLSSEDEEPRPDTLEDGDTQVHVLSICPVSCMVAYCFCRHNLQRAEVHPKPHPQRPNSVNTYWHPYSVWR